MTTFSETSPMTQHRALAPLCPPIQDHNPPVPLVGADGKTPLAATYSDGHRSMSVVYPQTERPARMHPLTLAIAVFLVGLGVALPIAAIGSYFDSQPGGQHHGE